MLCNYILTFCINLFTLLVMVWDLVKVRQLLEEQGRTRRWLALQCGINIGSLQQILNGRVPSRPVMKLMALALGVPESSFFSDGIKTQSEKKIASNAK